MGLNKEHQVELSTRTSTRTYMIKDLTIQKIMRISDSVNQF